MYFSLQYSSFDLKPSDADQNRIDKLADKCRARQAGQGGKMKKAFLLVSMILLSSVMVFSGIQWTTSLKTVGKGKRNNNDIAMTTSAQGGDVKQVFEGVANENPFYTQDGYWLYKNESGDIYVVNDAKRNYMVMNLDSLLQVTGALGQLVKITVSGHTIDTQLLGSEDILGFNCNHLKVTTEYTMKIKVAFIKKTMKIREVKEIWGTTKVPGLNEIGEGFRNKDFKTGIADLDEMIKKEMEQQKKIGFPLKVITQRTEMNKKGKVKNESTTTMTVTKIESKNFPKTFFEVPADYDQVEMPGSKGFGGLFKKK